MFQLLFLSLLLVFGGRVYRDTFKNRSVPRAEVFNQKNSQASPSSTQTTEPKVEGAKVEVKVETDRASGPTTKPTESDLSSFSYPGSKVISSSSSKLVLESTETAAKITDWYKTKINEKNMNAKTVVTTNSNGKIENKLVAANSREKIEIEIKGNDGGTLTITVNLSQN